MAMRLDPAELQEMAMRITTMHRSVARLGLWQDFAYTTAFAICCGALGALCGALVEVGVARLFA